MQDVNESRVRRLDTLYIAITRTEGVGKMTLEMHLVVHVNVASTFERCSGWHD